MAGEPKYLIKVGDYTVPSGKIRAGGYFYDGSVVWFETPALMSGTEYAELLSKIKENLIGGSTVVTAYSCQKGDYVSAEAIFLTPVPEVRSICQGEVQFNPIRITFTLVNGDNGEEEAVTVAENGRKTKEKRLENALLEYIEKHTKDTPPGIATTIPAAARALIELWKII